MSEIIRVKLYQEIKNYLLEMIEKNYLDPNYKLPSENQLSIKFKASRASARHALSELESEGVICRIQGKGSFISHNFLPKVPLFENSSHKESTLIALLIPGIDSRFYINIVEGVKKSINQFGYQMILIFTEAKHECEKEGVKLALSLNPLGIIILPVDNQIYNPEILKLSLRNFPIILLDRKFEGLDISCVASNHLNASFQATQLLFKKQHKHIGFISPTPKVASSVAERIRGYETALLEETTFSSSYKCYLSDNFELRKNEMYDFITATPNLTAIICEGGATGVELMHLYTSKAFNNRVIEFIFFDNEYEHYYSLLPIKPIIIDQNPYDIGFQSGLLMQHLINNPLDKKQIILSDTIIE